MRAALIAVFACACTSDAPPAQPTARHVFDHYVTPVLEQKCSGNTAGCHATVASDPAANPISFDLEQRDLGYAKVVSYAGNFDASAPLLLAHPDEQLLSQPVRDVIDMWFAAERAERGL